MPSLNEKKKTQLTKETELLPWDLSPTLCADAYTLLPSTSAASTAAADARRLATQCWHQFLSKRPLLYLPDRQPHGGYDPRVERGRQLWCPEEFGAFDAVVESRTQTLLLRQLALLHHWQSAATLIQAIGRGLLNRRRVQRMRQALQDAAQTASRARELATLRERQLNAALLIQTVFLRRSARLRLVFASRACLQRSIRLYLFQRRRRSAASTIQRAFRQYMRRVKLWQALRSVLRLLRRSRQCEQLDGAAVAFVVARRAAAERAQCERSQRYPRAAANAQRVDERKRQLVGDSTRALPLMGSGLGLGPFSHSTDEPVSPLLLPRLRPACAPSSSSTARCRLPAPAASTRALQSLTRRPERTKATRQTNKANQLQ